MKTWGFSSFSRMCSQIVRKPACKLFFGQFAALAASEAMPLVGFSPRQMLAMLNKRRCGAVGRLPAQFQCMRKHPSFRPDRRSIASMLQALAGLGSAQVQHIQRPQGLQLSGLCASNPPYACKINLRCSQEYFNRAGAAQ